MEYKGLIIVVLLMAVTGLLVERQVKPKVQVGCLLLPNSEGSDK